MWASVLCHIKRNTFSLRLFLCCVVLSWVERSRLKDGSNRTRFYCAHVGNQFHKKSFFYSHFVTITICYVGRQIQPSRTNILRCSLNGLFPLLFYSYFNFMCKFNYPTISSSGDLFVTPFLFFSEFSARPKSKQQHFAVHVTALTLMQYESFCGTHTHTHREKHYAQKTAKIELLQRLFPFNFLQQ